MSKNIFLGKRKQYDGDDGLINDNESDAEAGSAVKRKRKQKQDRKRKQKSGIVFDTKIGTFIEFLAFKKHFELFVIFLKILNFLKNF